MEEATSGRASILKVFQAQLLYVIFFPFLPLSPTSHHTKSNALQTRLRKAAITKKCNEEDKTVSTFKEG